MIKFKLKNGITVLHVKKPSNSVAIEVMVKVGSNYESKHLSGISHFLEHMLFEGTKKRKNGREIANEIEKLGGEMNAYTTTDRTAFFIKILNKHIDKAIDILSDMMKNSVFNKDTVDKERKVILKEIEMVNDQPRFFQWILFQKNLFKKNNAKNPTYGSKKTVKEISRKEIVNYFNKYYKPNNMIISVVGNVNNLKSKLINNFGGIKKGKTPEYTRKLETLNIKTKVANRKKLNNSYMVLGYKTPPRLSKDSYVLDLILGILGRGQSGRIFNEVRNKRGLAYDVGVTHESSIDYGYFAIHLNTDKKNINRIIKIILNEFKKLKKVSGKELNEAKTFIEGQFFMENDDNFQSADKLAYWELIKDAKLINNYIKEIKKINKNDIIKVVDKYLNEKYTLAVVQQE